ncbi:MAG: glycosyltransferase family 4 protein [Desulfomonilaceae bacterium]|nr:glycosyltransferase family 4 protein [Desulfomonilaceae bacterium]
MAIDRPLLVHVTTIPLSMNRFFEGQLRFMSDHGFTVAAVSSPGTMLDEVGKREQVAVYGIPMKRRISPLSDLRSLMRLTWLFRRIRPTIVNASTPKAALLGMLAAAIARVPVRVLVLHGLLTARRMRGFGFVLRMVSRISCLLAHRVCAVSNSVAEGMIEQRLCPRDKMKVLGNGSINGIDTERFDPGAIPESRLYRLREKLGLPADCPVIGFVGRLSVDKGIAELAQAWQLIRMQFPDARLLIIGPVDSENPVPSSVVDALKADPSVIMTDFVDHAELPQYYALMQVFVLPTYREGFPLCLLEASAMALPIVATRVPGCVDAVRHGVTGTLVPVHDPQSLADAVGVYLQDPRLAREHGRAGRIWVAENFNPERIWEAFRQEYVQLMREKGIPFC